MVARCNATAPLLLTSVILLFIDFRFWGIQISKTLFKKVIHVTFTSCPCRGGRGHEFTSIIYRIYQNL